MRERHWEGDRGRESEWNRWRSKRFNSRESIEFEKRELEMISVCKRESYIIDYNWETANEKKEKGSEKN